MNFQLDEQNTLPIDIVDTVSGLSLNDLMSDGRAAAAILRSLLPKTYDNVTAVRDKRGTYKLSIDGKILLIRILNEQGVKLGPSITKGGRREYEREAYDSLYRGIDGWVVADIRSWKVTMTVLYKEDTRWKATYKAAEWDELMEKALEAAV